MLLHWLCHMVAFELQQPAGTGTNLLLWGWLVQFMLGKLCKARSASDGATCVGWAVVHCRLGKWL